MIFRGSMEIPIYTLGSTGLTLAGQQEYTNMWHTTSESAVLRNILFYQLYGKFRDEDRTIEMDMAKEPYTGAITRKGKAFYILVVRNNREELTKFLSTYPKENIIVICEHIDHLQPFNEYLGGLNVRVTTDIDINKPFKDRFYKWHNNKWLKENTVTVN